MPLADYLTAPRRTAGFRQGLGPVRTPQGELRQWAHQVVEKVRVASVGGRLRFLPWYDPYTDESPEMRREYRTMLREPTIKAAVQTKILSVISEELQFQPDNPEDPREKEVAGFCKYAFGKLKGGVRELGWSVLHPALIDGVSICEKVRRVDPLPGGRFKGKRIFDKVKPKDSHFLQLGIDPFRNITAIRGTGFNAGKVWSPSDFIIFSYFPLYANPSGLSDFRAAYRAYWIKDTSWKLRSLHLENYTGPYLMGRYSTVEQKAALEDAFAEARANTWMTIPAAAMAEAIDLSMKGTSDFKDAIADCDKEMLIAIVGAHLQNLEGQSGSGRHGDTKVHREIGELIQWWLAATLADVYQAQLVVPLVEENYHDVEPPDVTVGAVTDEDMLQKAQVYKALQETGMELSRKEAYQTFSMSQPETPEDILRPPGQGGGAGGASPTPSPAPPEGGDGGSPNATFAEGDVHGPKPPGSGWVQVGTGPRGGKVWRREKGDKAPAAPAAAAAPARPVSPEQAAAVKDAFEEMTLYGEVRRDGIMRVDQARSVFNNKTGLDLSPAEFAGFLEDAHKAHALRLQIENHVNDAAAEPAYAATMPHFGDVAYGYVEPPRTDAGMEKLAAFAREYAAGARQVRAGNTLAAEVARGSKHAEGGDGGRRPFAEHRAFCQEGPNKGKPGPCPEEIEGHHAAADAHDKEARAAHKEAAKHARAAAATTERKTGNWQRDVPQWASKPLNEVQQLAGGGAKKPSPENLRQAVARADELLPPLERLAGANPAAARAAKAVRASRVAAQKALSSYAAAGQLRRAARLAQAGREGPHEAAVDAHAATLTAGDDWTTILEGDLSGPDVSALEKALDDVEDAHAHDDLPALRDAALRARKAGAAVAAAHAGQAEHAPSVAAARRLALAASRLVPALDELAAARAGRK